MPNNVVTNLNQYFIFLLLSLAPNYGFSLSESIAPRYLQGTLSIADANARPRTANGNQPSTKQETTQTQPSRENPINRLSLNSWNFTTAPTSFTLSVTPAETTMNFISFTKQGDYLTSKTASDEVFDISIGQINTSTPQEFKFQRRFNNAFDPVMLLPRLLDNATIDPNYSIKDLPIAAGEFTRSFTINETSKLLPLPRRMEYTYNAAERFPKTISVYLFDRSQSATFTYTFSERNKNPITVSGEITIETNAPRGGKKRRITLAIESSRAAQLSSPFTPVTAGAGPKEVADFRLIQLGQRQRNGIFNTFLTRTFGTKTNYRVVTYPYGPAPTIKELLELHEKQSNSVQPMKSVK